MGPASASTDPAIGVRGAQLRPAGPRVELEPRAVRLARGAEIAQRDSQERTVGLRRDLSLRVEESIENRTRVTRAVASRRLDIIAPGSAPLGRVDIAVLDGLEVLERDDLVSAVSTELVRAATDRANDAVVPLRDLHEENARVARIEHANLDVAARLDREVLDGVPREELLALIPEVRIHRRLKQVQAALNVPAVLVSTRHSSLNYPNRRVERGLRRVAACSYRGVS